MNWGICLLCEFADRECGRLRFMEQASPFVPIADCLPFGRICSFYWLARASIFWQALCCMYWQAHRLAHCWILEWDFSICCHIGSWTVVPFCIHCCFGNAALRCKPIECCVAFASAVPESVLLLVCWQGFLILHFMGQFCIWLRQNSFHKNAATRKNEKSWIFLKSTCNFLKSMVCYKSIWKSVCFVQMSRMPGWQEWDSPLTVIF